MKQSSNLGLALYDKTDLMNITGLENSLNHNMELIDSEISNLSLKAGQLCNPNLLDNWYFGNPVDQRGGYVVPPGTAMYNDTDCTVFYNYVGAYTKVFYVNEAYGEVTWDGTAGAQRYVKRSDMVRGYTGEGYGIDRWTGLDRTTLILSDCVRVINSNNINSIWWHKTFLPNNSIPVGTTVTISALVKVDQGIPFDIILQHGSSAEFPGNAIVKKTGQYELLTYTTTRNADSGNNLEFGLVTHGGAATGNNDYIDVKALKIELGTEQTLAHQDADGNWVLNEIPDYGEQLRRCQRYFYVSGSIYINCESRVDHLAVPYFLPKMRTIPSCTVYAAPNPEQLGTAKRTTNYVSGIQIDSTGDVWVNIASIGSSGGTLLVCENKFDPNQYAFKIVANAEL